MKKFKKHVSTEEEKKLIGYLTKKKRVKKVNVYFNKKTSDGQTKYLSGDFYSRKNNTEYFYRSSYELKCFLDLENNLEVDSYVSEGMSLPYKDSKGMNRTYIPDLLVLYKDGSMCVWEIKPKEMVKDADVQLKAEACKKYLKSRLSGIKVDYKFITEEDLFKTPKEYTGFIAKARKVNYSKRFSK